MTKPTLDEVHAALRPVMIDNAEGAAVSKDEAGHLSIDRVELDAKGRPRWFGGVQTKKNYVS